MHVTPATSYSRAAPPRRPHRRHTHARGFCSSVRAACKAHTIDTAAIEQGASTASECMIAIDSVDAAVLRMWGQGVVETLTFQCRALMLAPFVCTLWVSL